MDIKLLALDLDGTLLDTEKHLSAHTREVLERAADRGICIVPATGRAVTCLAREVRDLKFIDYALTSNGAAMWELKTGKLIIKNTFQPEQAKEIWDFVKSYDTMFDCCIDGSSRMEPEYYAVSDDYMPDGPRRRFIKESRVPTENLRSWLDDESRNIEKFNLFFKADRQEDKARAREELKRFPYLAVTSSLGNNIEINHITATKGRGLMALADYLGIPPEKVMAFGDGENDISMLKAAGVGVAMGNAEQVIKDIADLVTTDNDSDGVAYMIETKVLI